jgi:DNA-directed RNA polymerase subunit RPC12/RpoP
MFISFFVNYFIQYWAESARELGFVDTDADIRFSTVSPMAVEDVEYTTSNSVDIRGGNNTMNDTNPHSSTTPARPRIVTPVDFPTESNICSPLVRMDDKGLVQDHVFLAFAQMEPTILTTADKVGPWKDKMCGEKGLRCRHCQGRSLTKGKTHGRWYPSSAKNLGQTTTMNSIVK